MLKCAIIGCGSIANKHAENISRKGKLLAVCDINLEKAQSVGDKFQAKVYDNYKKLLRREDIDLISICTPNSLHAIHTIDSLKAGCHVICEKPMALSVRDCKKMIATATIKKKYLFVVKQNRFNPPVAALKKVIDQRKLGKIYSFQLNCFWNRNEEYYKNSWRGKKDLAGGTLYTQFSHFIDLLYWFFGDIKDIKAKFNNYHHQGLIEFEDTGILLLEFMNGVLGTVNYTVNSYRENLEGSLIVFGEKGTVKIGGKYLNSLEYQNIEDYFIDNIERVADPNFYGTYYGSMSNHDKVYDNVFNVLINGSPTYMDNFDALKTVEIIHKIYKNRK